MEKAHRNYTITAINFAKNFISNPLLVGSICPSSPTLCKTIVNLIPKGDGLILDLGAGTGVISKYLLKNGVPAKNIVAVEYSHDLCCTIKKQMPNINVICGDACQLNSILQEQKRYNPNLDNKIHAVVSSLPFKSLPKKVCKEIFTQIQELCQDNSAYLLQYTYALWQNASLEKEGFSSQKKGYVFRNIPPARVDLYSAREINR